MYNNLSPKEETRSDLPLEGIYEKLSTKFKNSLNVKVSNGFIDYLSKIEKK